MKQSVNNSDFHTAFNNMNRGDQFSYDAKNALFEYLEEYEQDCDTEVELDVIASAATIPSMRASKHGLMTMVQIWAMHQKTTTSAMKKFADTSKTTGN